MVENGQIESHERVWEGKNKANLFIFICSNDIKMLADYTRRYREYTGPTPHSVAIVSHNFLCLILRWIFAVQILSKIHILKRDLCTVYQTLGDVNVI
jgi:predicted ATP-grasp superfamily ATP-dependent carboligase